MKGGPDSASEASAGNMTLNTQINGATSKAAPQNQRPNIDCRAEFASRNLTFSTLLHVAALQLAEFPAPPTLRSGHRSGPLTTLKMLPAEDGIVLDLTSYVKHMDLISSPQHSTSARLACYERIPDMVTGINYPRPASLSESSA